MPDETTSVKLARIEEKLEGWATTHAEHVKQDGLAFERIEKALVVKGDWVRAIVAPFLVGVMLILANRYWPTTPNVQAAPVQHP